MMKPSTAYVDVSIATLWSASGMNRPIDEPSITNPVHPWEWTRSMTLDEKLWLVGKVETQALLGNKVTIIDTQSDWVKILVHNQTTPKDPQGYPGWVPSKQLAYTPIFEQMEQEPFVLITKPTTLLYSTPTLDQPYLEISFNTRLPLLEESESYQVLLPNGISKWMKKEAGKRYNTVGNIPIPTGKDIVQTAKQFMGLPYLWGGMSGFGFDCSGFTFSMYQAHGVQIPRDSGPQSKAGLPVQREALQPGDLLFFSDQAGHITHVSMYVNNGLMIHAPESAKSIEIISIETPRFAETFVCARRYLG